MGRKKSIFLIVIVFALGAFLLLNLSLWLKYDISLINFIKYSRDLSGSEKEYLEAENLSCTVYNNPPLSFVSKYSDRSSGLMIDYISQISTEIEKDIRVVSAENLKNKPRTKDDGFRSIRVMEKATANLKKYDFTESIFEGKGKILVKGDSSWERVRDLRGGVLVTIGRDPIRDEAIEKRFLNKEGNKLRIVRVDNIYEGFALLRNNQAVGFIGDEIQLAYYLNVTNQGNGYRFIDEDLYKRDVCLAVKKGDDMLMSILNKGIMSIKKKNLIMQTQNKWLGGLTPDGRDVKQIDLFSKILLAVILIILAFSSWNYVMKRRVNEKTRELTESKEELKQIIDTLDRGILVINEERKVIECNAAINRITGVAREELIGRDYTNIDDLKPFTGEKPGYTIRLKNAYYLTSRKEFKDGKKTLLTIEDCTEKNIRERRSRQEAKMVAVGQLSAGLAHEIRNPLGLIKNYGFLLRKYCQNDGTDHAIKIIDESVERINSLIDNLLKFSRLSADTEKQVDVEKLINQIVMLEREGLKDRDIEIRYRVGRQDGKPILVNEDVLKMVILNLISNSIDAFSGVEGRKKEIFIEAIVQEFNLIIEVEDNGDGIRSEDLENIFNPFFSTKEDGSGLGLYLISSELSKLDGQLTVESIYGSGSKFKAILPIGGTGGREEDEDRV